MGPGPSCVAHAIVNPVPRAKSPAAIVAALPASLPSQMASGDQCFRASASRMLGLALAGDGWLAALPVLGRMRPDGVLAVRDRLTAGQNRADGQSRADGQWA